MIVLVVIVVMRMRRMIFYFPNIKPLVAKLPKALWMLTLLFPARSCNQICISIHVYRAKKTLAKEQRTTISIHLAMPNFMMNTAINSSICLLFPSTNKLQSSNTDHPLKKVIILGWGLSHCGSKCSPFPMYHLRPHFLGIFPYIGLKHRPYIGLI